MLNDYQHEQARIINTEQFEDEQTSSCCNGWENGFFIECNITGKECPFYLDDNQEECNDWKDVNEGVEL
jgi:hypothetical protein